MSTAIRWMSLLCCHQVYCLPQPVHCLMHHKVLNLVVDNAAEPLGEARKHQLGGLRGLEAWAPIIWGTGPRGGAARGASPGSLGVRIKPCATVPPERGEGNWQHEALLGKGGKQTCRRIIMG